MNFFPAGIFLERFESYCNKGPGLDMAKRIVIPLNRHSKIEEILPYLVKITRPGMKVVFLIHYPVESWSYPTTESPTKAMLAGREILHRSSWDLQRGLAERKIAPARESLYSMQVEVAVHVYTGRLKKLLAAYKDEDETYLIILPLTRLWRTIVGKIPLLGFLKQPGFSPVMLQLV